MSATNQAAKIISVPEGTAIGSLRSEPDETVVYGYVTDVMGYFTCKCKVAIFFKYWTSSETCVTCGRKWTNEGETGRTAYDGKEYRFSVAQ